MKYTLNENYLNEIDTPEKAYFLGFFCADGAFMKGKNGIVLNLASQDIDILEKIKVIFNSNSPIRKLKPSGRGKQMVSRLILYGKIFRKSFDKYKISEQKTQKLCFPNNLPDIYFSHFLRGYFDGDGWLTFFRRKSGNRINKLESVAGIVSTKMFIQEISEKLNSIGIINKTFFKKVKSMELWRLQIYGAYQVLKFLDYIYNNSTIHLDRKFNNFIKFLKEVNLKNDNYSSSKRMLVKNNLLSKYDKILGIKGFLDGKEIEV